jgi:hypothetical protein
MQSDGKKLSYVMMVAIHNLRLERDHCTLKKMYESVLSNAVNVTNAS